VQLGRALRLVWQTAPTWTLVNSLLVFVQGVLPLVSLYLMKRILDAVSASLAAPHPASAFQPVVFLDLAGRRRGRLHRPHSYLSVSTPPKRMRCR